jgi:hypothetical protein
MFQAFVYSLRTGKATYRDFKDVEGAAQSLAALIRTSGYPLDRDELASELATGRAITLGQFMYWVREAP